MAKPKNGIVEQAIINLTEARKGVAAGKAFTKATPDSRFGDIGDNGRGTVMASVLEETTEKYLELSIQQLSFMHRTGQRLAKILQIHGRTGLVIMVDFCGISLDYALKLVTFADEYTDEQIQELCFGENEVSPTASRRRSQSKSRS